MKKLREIIKDKTGISTVETAIIFLVIMMVFSVVLEYSTMYSIATTTENDAQRVLDSLIIKNATSIFASIKNGRSNIIEGQYSQRELAEALGFNWDTYMADLTDEMSLAKDGDKFYRGDSDDNVFIMPSGNTEFQVKTLTETRLEITAQFRVGRTVYFFGSVPFSYSIPFTITSNYTKKNAVSTGEELPTEEETSGNLLGQQGDNVIIKEPSTASNNVPTSKPFASGITG